MPDGSPHLPIPKSVPILPGAVPEVGSMRMPLAPELVMESMRETSSETVPEEEEGPEPDKHATGC